MEPKRFRPTHSDEKDVLHPNVKPLHSMFMKTTSKLLVRISSQ